MNAVRWQRQYKRRQHWVGRRVQLDVCKLYDIDIKVKDKWYEHEPAPVIENERY